MGVPFTEEGRVKPALFPVKKLDLAANHFVSNGTKL